MARNNDVAPETPQPFQVVKTDRQMSKVRFSLCGTLIAAAGRDATLRRWELPPEGAVAVEPILAAGEKKPSATTSPPELVELPQIRGHNGWATDLVFHTDQQRLFSADSWGQIACWEYTKSESQLLWKNEVAHEGWVRQLALSPDGQTLASCSVDQKVCLWSTADGKKLQELNGHDEDVFALAFHPDGQSLVSGDLKGMVLQWDLGEFKQVRRFDAQVLYRYDRIQDVGGVRVLAFDREGKTLAVAGAKPTSGGFVLGVPAILFFDWQSADLNSSPELGTNKDVYIHDLVFHRDGYWIGVTSGQPGEGKVFMIRPGETQPFFTSKLANCHSVDIHPSGTRLAIASNAGTFGQRPSKAKEGEYDGNWSPINLWRLPALLTDAQADAIKLD